MTELLEKAFTEASKLAALEQDALAVWILEELASERRWNKMFERTPQALTHLAAEALAEYRSGQAETLDPDKL